MYLSTQFQCMAVLPSLKGQGLHRVKHFIGLQSKRPQVKTSPSQNVPELVKTSPKIGQNVPMVKNVGQNVPKMIFFKLYILCYFRHNLVCLDETVLDRMFFNPDSILLFQ